MSGTALDRDPASAPVGLRDILSRLAAGDRPLFARATALQLLSGLTEGLSIALLIPLLHFMDTSSLTAEVPVRPRALSGLLGETVTFGLGGLLVFFVALVALRAWLQRATAVATSALVHDFALALRRKLFSAAARADWRTLAGARNADLQHALTGEIERMQNAAMSAMTVLRAGLVVAVYLVISLLVSIPLTVIAAGFGVLIVAALRPVRKRARRYGDQFTDGRRDQVRVVTDFLGGAKVNKAFLAEGLYEARLLASLKDLRDAMIGYVRMQGSASALVQIGTAASVSLFLYIGLAVLGASIATMLTMIVLYFRFGGRATVIQNGLQEIGASASTLSATTGLIARFEAAAEPEEEGDAPSLGGGIAFDGVSYTHPGAAAPALSDVRFEVEAGALTTFIGPTGSGKTTAVDIALGLLVPEAGRVLIGGAPLSPARRRAWRRQVALLPQDPALAHTTVAENVRLGRADATDAQVQDALRLAGAWDFVSALPGGTAHVVGERGQLLSGGQQQKIALARALVGTPQLLILDEPTSALDPASEEEIVETILALKGTLTILAVSHRPALVEVADKVVRFAVGRVETMPAPQGQAPADPIPAVPADPAPARASGRGQG